MKLFLTSILIIALYVAIGAVLASTYFYLRVKESKYYNNLEPVIWIGTLWPLVAPFAFGIYFAKTYAEKERKSER